jgi:hypothetical protein|tara:strand:+ start:345 stop:737 length:393 start_codon:yes stop_codon:yes gene_type:complete
MNKKGSERAIVAMGFFIIAIVIIGLIGLAMWGLPKYRIYKLELSGQADLKEAEWTKKILIEEAIANLEAQKLNALSEVERAKGMAKAIDIENGELTDKYIQYLWVRNIDKMDGEKIYIPTESNLPILEAR